MTVCVHMTKQKWKNPLFEGQKRFFQGGYLKKFCLYHMFSIRPSYYSRAFCNQEHAGYDGARTIQYTIDSILT